MSATAELGLTTDPRTLIPGDPEAVRQIVSGWHAAATTFDGAGTTVGKTQPDSWTGTASDSFVHQASATRTGMLAASDSLTGAGRAVTQYADTLEWAQGQASSATALWQTGQQAAATALLTSAREQVATAGDHAAATVRGASTGVSGFVAPRADPPPAPHVPSLWNQVIGAHPVPGTISADSKRIHILYGDKPGSGGHIYGSGMPDKNVFPESWTAELIMDAVNDVANDPDQVPKEQRDGSFVASGTRDGVTIEVIVKTDSSVQTAYPTGGEGVCLNDAAGDPIPITRSGADESDTQAQRSEQESESDAVAEANGEVWAEAHAEAEAKAEAAAKAQAAAQAEAREQALLEAQLEAQEQAELMAQAEMIGMEDE